MGSFGNAAIQRRHFTVGETRTTIGLEAGFWETLEAQRGIEWKQWVGDVLSGIPMGVGRASWLRLHILAGCCVMNNKHMDTEKH